MAQAPSTTVQTHTTEVTIIYFACGHDPFGEGEAQAGKWPNHFSKNLFEQLGDKARWICINNYNMDKKSAKERGIKTFYYTSGSFKTPRENGVYYNGNKQSYGTVTEDDRCAYDSPFDYDLTDAGSTKFYADWLDRQVENSTKNGEHVLVIDGFGTGDIRENNFFILIEFIFKQSLRYKDNTKVTFVTSCPCCDTMTIPKNLSQIIKIEECDEAYLHPYIIHTVPDNCIKSSEVTSEYVKEFIKSLNLPQTQKAVTRVDNGPTVYLP